MVQKIYLLHATFPSGRFTLYNLGAIASSQGVSFLSKSKTALKTSHEELAFVSVLITNYPCADIYIFRMYIKKLMWNTQRWTYLMRRWKMLRKDWAADKIWQRSWQEIGKVSECTSVFWECLRLSQGGYLLAVDKSLTQIRAKVIGTQSLGKSVPQQREHLKSLFYLCYPPTTAKHNTVTLSLSSMSYHILNEYTSKNSSLKSF